MGVCLIGRGSAVLQGSWAGAPSDSRVSLVGVSLVPWFSRGGSEVGSRWQGFSSALPGAQSECGSLPLALRFVTCGRSPPPGRQVGGEVSERGECGGLGGP